MAVRHVSDHQRHLSTAILEAGVSMKDMESKGKQFGFPWLAFCSQWGDHHIRGVSEEGLNPSLYDLCLEWPQADAFPHHNQLVNAPLRGPPLAPSTRVSTPTVVRTTTPHWQESRCTNLTVADSIERWSISLSWITLIILLIMQVPMTKGTLCLNSD